LGDYAAAKATLKLAKAEAAGAPALLIRPILELGTLQYNQDSFHNAIALYEEVQQRYQELEATQPDLIDWELASNESLARFNLANSNFQLEDYALAERQYLEVLPYLEAYERPGDVGLLQNNLAWLFTKTGQFRQAEQWLIKGQSTAEALNDARLTAQNASHWGGWHLAQGRPTEAATAQQQAQAALLPEYDPSSYFEAPPLAQLKYADYQTDLFIYITDQARALDAMEGKGAEKAEALSRLYRTGDALLDNLRQQQSGQGSKLFWREKTSTFYEQAILHCHQSNLTQDAFFFFEKSKAILLYEAILGSDALRELPDSLRQRERQLAQAVTTAQSAMASDSGQDRASALEGVISAQRDLTQFRSQLRRQFPRYRALTENIVVPAPTAFYENTLASTGQALLHYFVGPTQTFALYLDQSGLQTFNLGETDSLQEIATELLAYFSKPTDIQNDPAGYAAAAIAVYRAFLTPLSLSANQSLLIIPDGPLTYLPFPALLTEEVADANQLSSLPYLLRRHPISYGHSASILSRKRPTNTSGDRMVAFAPVVNGSATMAYPPLPFSEDELQQITKAFQVDLLTSEAATLAQFREKAVDANVLHLSTHAFASADAGAPLIAFHDQPLYLREVYHQDLNADLVVLSACQTNIGKLAKGEGVLGLGRGFIQAGAASVIASLWNVNARAGGQVLSNFYQTIGQGETKGMALHQAQLSYLDDATMRDVEKSPYLWAGLTYYGTETGLELPPAKSGKGFLWGALIGILGLALVWVWNSRVRE
jgi:CHAT domain-containing protein